MSTSLWGNLGSPQSLHELTPAIAQALEQERFREFIHTMNVVLKDDDFTFTGTSVVEFTNNTGDTLAQLFFHAHFNAFQPNSPSHRRAEQVGPNRLRPEIFANLKPSEIGKLDITRGMLGGAPVQVSREWTIIRLDLPKKIVPGERVRLEFEFAGQVPVQIRRSGRLNAQGVRYSMAQWFPKLCQYDQHGWQNNQFAAREFYGVWGKYDVKLTVPKRLVVGASGELQNPLEVGHGYERVSSMKAGDTVTVFPPLSSVGGASAAQPMAQQEGTTTWHFIAFPVHDFAWTADYDYAHGMIAAANGSGQPLMLHTLFKSRYARQWERMKDWLPRIFTYMARFMPYPYRSFTCTNAGDGGMEYPNLVMITHRADPVSLLGVTVHEAVHQWFYGLAANNETKHAWMDEGLTDYMTTRIMQEEFKLDENPVVRGIEGEFSRLLVPERPFGLQENLFYLNQYRASNDEPLSIQHDRFNSEGSAVLVYRKGAAIMRQFEYSFGQSKTDEFLRAYLRRWMFRHPYPPDMEKVAEDVFGHRLDEVFDTFLQTTELPDYTIHAINSAPVSDGWKTQVQLSKRDRAHVPLVLMATDETGTTHQYRIPTDILNAPTADKTVLPAWYWTYKDYTAEFVTPSPITLVRLDTTGKLLDSYLPDNLYQTRKAFWENTAFWQTASSIITLGATKNLFGRGVARTGWWTRFDEAQPLDYTGASFRPSLWYNAFGGAQIGLRTDITSNWNRQKFMAGLYYNLRRQDVDFQFGWSTQDLAWGRFLGSSHWWLGNVDGVTGLRARNEFSISTPFPWTLKDEERELGSTESRGIMQKLRFVADGEIYWLQDRSYLNVVAAPALVDRLLGRATVSTEVQWQRGWARADLALSYDGTAEFTGQATIRSQQTLFDAPAVRGVLRTFGFFGSANTPFFFRPTLGQGSPVEQFTTIPFRFLRFVPVEYPETANRVFLPNGSGIVRGSEVFAPYMLAIGITLGEARTFDVLLSPLGINIPVLNALKPSVYGSLAYTIESGVRRIGIQWDSGFSLALNLNDALAGSRLLWMFPHDVSATLYVPLASYQNNRWQLGTDGIRIGISTAMTLNLW
jgi:hypothetical protein